jgi:hypothetical protein
METAFKHPLARRATITSLRQRDGGEHPLLVIVTTLDLDPEAKRFSKKNFDRLHAAAHAFVAATPDIFGYSVVNRPKEWDA